MKFSWDIQLSIFLFLSCAGAEQGLQQLPHAANSTGSPGNVHKLYLRDAVSECATQCSGIATWLTYCKDAVDIIGCLCRDPQLATDNQTCVDCLSQHGGQDTATELAALPINCGAVSGPIPTGASNCDNFCAAFSAIITPCVNSSQERSCACNDTQAYEQSVLICYQCTAKEGDPTAANKIAPFLNLCNPNL